MASFHSVDLILHMSFTIYHLLLYSEKVLGCAFLNLINEYRLSKVFDHIFFEKSF